MIRPFAPLSVLALLAACAAEPAPRLDATETVSLQRSREVLMKGSQGGHFTSAPMVVRFTYTIACAADNQGGTPQQRADRLIAEAPKVAGQVYIPIGEGYQRSDELRKLNTSAVPRHRCEVRDMSREGIASGDAAFLSAALRLGAMQELVQKR